MNRDHVRVLGGVFRCCCVDEALGLDPILMARAGMNSHDHAEGLRDLRHFTADVAVTDDPDALAFNFLGGEVLQVTAGIKLGRRSETVHLVHREIGQNLQQCLERHLCRCAAIEGGRVHQGRHAALAVTAAP